MISAFGDMLGAALGGSLIGFAGDMLGMNASNAANLQAVRETNEANAANVKATNEANLEQVRLTNAANAEQANLAYQRSLPVNQVRDLMDAGMSKAGALNKLAGGGVYTPPALQAGTSQTSTSQAPHFDYSGISQAFERLGSIPAVTMQAQIQREQLNALREELQMKRDAARREQDKHDFDMWREQYGKESATILDAVSSRVADALLQSGKDIGDFKSFESLIRGLNLQDDKDLKRMPHLARTQLYDAVSQKFADERARQQQQNQNVSAKDAHDLASLDRLLKQINLSEERQSLIYKLGVLANNLELSNLAVDSANYEKALRDAGFANKKEAAAAIAAAENLEADERKNRSRFRSVRSDSSAAKLGYALEWMLDKINPFKGLISK